MAEQVERSFEAAVNLVKSMPKQGTFRPSYESMLKFYGLFKQAKEGVCTQPKPGFWDVIKKAKWEAWSSLGDMARTEAMGNYVSELKETMQNIPDTEQVADFTEVLKEFYEVAYEVNNEEPPAILRIFKKKKKLKAPENKVNGHRPPNEKQGKRSRKHHKAAETNGRDAASENGHFENVALSSGLEMENGVPQPLFIVDVKQLKKDKDNDNDNDSGIQNGDWEVHTLESNGQDTAEHSQDEQEIIIITSDESDDEEFCDSLDPEHLQVLQNGSTFETNGDKSSTDSSPEHVSNSTYTDSSGPEDQTVLTSTPFSRKALHVTFAVDDQNESGKENSEPMPSGVNGISELDQQNPGCINGVPVAEEEYERTWRSVNGDCMLTPQGPGPGPEKLEGILKPHQAGRGCGGGETGNRQTVGSRGSSGEGSRPQHQRGTRYAPGVEASQGSLSRGYKGHSDSESDDDDPTSRSDYDSAEEERTSRILVALERLQQDMNSILRRLDTMEAARPSTLHSPGTVSQPWWTQYIPSKSVVFLVLWPFLVNIILRYFRRRKAPSHQR